MKIDNYIKDLKYKCMDLKRKRDELYDLSDRCKWETGSNPYYDKITETRIELEEKREMIRFLMKLRKEMEKNEMQNKKSR